MSETQDEKAALIETESVQDEHQQCVTVAKQSESKLTLYHWTQSFNSQKVGVIMFQHHSAVDSSSSEFRLEIWFKLLWMTLRFSLNSSLTICPA